MRYWNKRENIISVLYGIVALASVILLLFVSQTENAQIPNAQAKADKLIQNAEYLKQKRINEAVEQVAMFNAMYEEYAQNPSITKSRMYYEAISKVLPGVKLYINSGDGSNLQTLLPLEPMTTVEGGQ